MSWNKGAAQVFGYTADEAIGRKVQALIVPVDRISEFRSLQDQLLSGELIESLETERLTKEGKRIDIALTLSPILDVDGKIAGSSAIARDISINKSNERELAEYREHLEKLVEQRTQALLQSREQLRRSERLASIGALAAGIAHEINNPVGAMMLSAQNALDASVGVTSADELRSLLERTCSRVASNAKRCGLIVKGILQFSRKQSTPKTPNDINAILNTSVLLLRESIELRHVSIDFRLSEDMPLMWVNQVEMEQVFVNLIKNAAESTDSQIVIEISTSHDGDRARISVNDTGPGMSAEQCEHIFDPFYTTRQQKGGTGLGLSIVHGIVTDHGGSVDVRSDLGCGTMIEISLPLFKAQTLEENRSALS